MLIKGHSASRKHSFQTNCWRTVVVQDVLQLLQEQHTPLHKIWEFHFFLINMLQSFKTQTFFQMNFYVRNHCAVIFYASCGDVYQI